MDDPIPEDLKPTLRSGPEGRSNGPHGCDPGEEEGLFLDRPSARALSWWVAQARRFAWLIVAVAVGGAAGGGYYAATHLTMTTNTDAMLSPELSFRKTYSELDKAFPQLGDNIAIVIDGETPDQAESAAQALAERLRSRTDLFREVFYPQGDPFFRRNGLLFLSVEELYDLSNRLADAQPLLAELAGDMTLRGMFDLLGEGADEVATGDAKPGPMVRVLNMIGDTVERFLEGRPQRLSWLELMSPDPLDPSDYRRFVTVQPRPDYSTLTPARTALGTIREIAADLGLDEAHGARVRLTGSVPILEDELASVKNSVGRAGVISFVLVSILIFIGFRSSRLVAGTVVTLIIGLMWTAAFAAAAIGHLNLISVAFAVLFIGLSVDFSIQFGLRYEESIDSGHEHGSALRRAAVGTGRPVGLAALCAAIGFLSFVPTAYVGLSELGIIAGAGMFIGALATLTLLPALLTLLPPRPNPRRFRQANAMMIGVLTARHARKICIGAFVVGIAALGAVPFTRFDFDPINLRDPSTESVQTYRDLARDPSTSPYTINVLAPDIDAASRRADRLEKLAVVDDVVTLRSFVPEDQDEKLDIIDNMAVFLTPVMEFIEHKGPATAAERQVATAKFRDRLDKLAVSPKAGPLAAPARRLAGLLGRFERGPGQTAGAHGELESLLLANLPGRLAALRESMQAGPVALKDIPSDLRARYLAPDGRARIEVYPAERLTDHDALRRFVAEVQAVAPNATDTPVVLLDSGDTIIRSFEEAGLLSLGMILIVLLVVLRNVRDSILVLSPLVLATLLTVAYTVVFNRPFNFANVIAVPLLFSLGIAFGVYLVLRYREVGSVPEMLATSTPRAVVFSALTTLAAFGSLVVSSHPGTASMGELLAVSLLLALVCTIIVLPAFLSVFRNRPARASDPHRSPP